MNGASNIYINIFGRWSYNYVYFPTLENIWKYRERDLEITKGRTRHNKYAFIANINKNNKKIKNINIEQEDIIYHFIY